MNDSLLRSEALALGLTDRQLHGPHWSRLSHGLFTPPSTAPAPLTARCSALMKVLPAGAAMAHLSAAQLYELWLPGLPAWLPVLAVLPPGELRPERGGLYVFRSRAALPPPVSVGGVAAVPPEVCVGQLAEDLSLVDLVIAIDSALQRKLCTTADITASLRSRQRGLPNLRQALALCDGRSESPWETVLRLLHVTAGFEVDPQADIRHDDGGFIARADLRIRGTRRLPEYDGAGHREREQHRLDLAREKALAREHWERYGYVAKEILGEPERVIRDAEQALGLPHDGGRLATWCHLVGQSSLTPEGWVRLLRRLHRFNRPLRGRKL
jgi:hypothetical protein